MPDLPDSTSPSGPSKAVFGPKALAIIAGAIWLLVVLAYCLLTETESGILIPLMVALLPLAPLYFAASAQAEVKRLRQEIADLRETLSARPLKANPNEPRLRPIKQAARPKVSIVTAPRQPEASPQQPSLALDTPQAQPLSHDDLIRALHFPENGADHARIASLRLALQQPEIAKLIRSAQDMLMLLSQEGVFMDDLAAGSCDPKLWRRFAMGERSPEVAAIGQISNQLALERSAQRLHDDPVFRDAAHHFLRGYDRLLQGLLSDISDENLAQLAQTRTARAFALCARAIGVFE